MEHERKVSLGYAVGIELTRPEIEYDVDFASNRYAKTHFDNKKAAMNAVTGEEEADWMDRQIMSALARIEEKLAWCLKKPAERIVTDEIEAHPVSFKLGLLMPSSWRGSAKTLTSMIHQYVVDSVLSDWFLLIGNDALSQNYKLQSLDEIRYINREARKQGPITGSWNL